MKATEEEVAIAAAEEVDDGQGEWGLCSVISFESSLHISSFSQTRSPWTV